MWILVILMVLLCPDILFAQNAGGFQPSVTIELKDEGTSQGNIKKIDCTGTGITCTRTGVTGTLNVTGGGGGGTWTTVEIDFGVAARFVAKTTVTDASVTGTSKIIVVQAGTAATGRQADENEMDAITCSGIPATGTFTLQCLCQRSVTHGLFKIHYTVG